MKSEPHYSQLDYQDLQTIAISLERGLSLRAIGRVLNRNAATISREIARNSGGNGYSCRYAQQREVRRRRHADHCPSWSQATPCLNPSLNCFASVGHPSKLQPTWLNCIPAIAPNAPRMKPSTCVIYAQPRGVLRKELIACLRMTRTKRWPRSKGEDRRGQMANLLSIHVRPPEIEDRQFPGHWEGDLIKGALNQSAVGTLVEQNTRLLILVKLPHHHPATAAHVLQAFTDKLQTIAQPMRQTLTYDRGTEMAYHQQLSANTGIAVYFCDPHSPWQRGTNENTNGLVRQFLPKGTDLSGYSQ